MRHEGGPETAGGQDSENWSTVLDAILEGLQVIGPDFRYLHLNETAARHGRSTKEALLGRTMMECYPGIQSTELFAELGRCMSERTSTVLENAFTFPDGRVGYFELRLQPVPEGVCVLSIDVTARKVAELARADAEERLRHAQRMEAIGQLAAGIAHDFNNLLTVILSHGELALDSDDEQRRDDIQIMLRAARSSAELTKQLLTYGRRVLQRRQVLDVREVVRELEVLLRRSLDSRIELAFDIAADVPRVEVDRSQLEQILMNLVINARDAIADRGRITVAVGRAFLDEDHVRAHPGAQVGLHTVLIVSDTGGGMDAATQARIFEPFFTTKERGKGTGLGLATVYGIVKQSGGNIWLYSEPGVGTTFKIYLPATDRIPSVATAAVPVQRERRQRSGTILVAEDAPALADLIRDVLSGLGLEVLTAANGEAAMAIFEERHGRIDLLMSDLMMPGCGGLALVRELRARQPNLPIICTSGYAEGHVIDANALPADVSFVEKPFTPRILIDRVADLLPE